MDATPANSSTVLVLHPSVAITHAKTAGVRLFERRPPVHSLLLGRCRLALAGRSASTHDIIAVPANTPHNLLALEGPYAAVAYLDARRFRFEDAQRLAEVWRGFVPGQDDLREAMGDALALQERRVDPRLLSVLDALETERLGLSEAAARVGLSDSRMTHLMTDTLGAPPSTWRTWFKLRRALHLALLGGSNLTQAAHEAGFADSAHLTRTCKQLMGVRPAQMLPHTVHVIREP